MKENVLRMRAAALRDEGFTEVLDFSDAKNYADPWLLAAFFHPDGRVVAVISRRYRYSMGTGRKIEEKSFADANEWKAFILQMGVRIIGTRSIDEEIWD